MLRTSLAALALTLVATLPAHAVLCTDTGSIMTFEYYVGDDLRVDEEARNEYDLINLRQRGVDAVRVERWSNCIRAFVRTEDGREEMQFFNPGSYQRRY